MSFQAYLDNIKAKTGKTPEDFKKAAEAAGQLKPDWKATQFIAWMKKGIRPGPRALDGDLALLES